MKDKILLNMYPNEMVELKTRDIDIIMCHPKDVRLIRFKEDPKDPYYMLGIRVTEELHEYIGVPFEVGEALLFRRYKVADTGGV